MGIMHIRGGESKVNFKSGFESVKILKFRKWWADEDKYVEEQYDKDKKNYLFVDEVQLCPKFELAINSLYSKNKYDIYVTGSNAFLLSADLATLFTGRYIEIHMFPFSFKEYCEYYSEESDRDKLFDEYFIKGGLAGSYAYHTDLDRTTYIKEIIFQERRYQEKPIFQGLQKLWNAVRCAGIYIECNTYAAGMQQRYWYV